MTVTESIAYFIRDVIDALGYAGVAVLMALENSILPIPSEAILCFAGWLAFDGRMDPVLVTLAGTIGSVMGCVLMYYIGLHGGRRVVRRWGRYIHVREKDLDGVTEWFEKHGELAVLSSRMVPVLRTIISIPAGMSRMKMSKFVVYTFMGTLPYVALLTYLGYLLGPNWATLFEVIGQLEAYIFIAVILSILAFLAWRRWGPRKPDPQV